jgi:hypothetical protein
LRRNLANLMLDAWAGSRNRRDFALAISGGFEDAR